jgi:hypothetical protein
VAKLYESIVQVLVDEHADLLWDPAQSHHHRVEEEEEEDDENYDDEEEDEEWMYSIERFYWAFALVNSRHWHLPIPSSNNNQQQEEEDDHSNINNKKKICHPLPLQVVIVPPTVKQPWNPSTFRNKPLLPPPCKRMNG